MLRVPLEQLDEPDDFGEALNIDELDLDGYQRTGLEQLWMPHDLDWLIHGDHESGLTIIGEPLARHPLIVEAARTA